jgi:ADP-ribose pyrophosphatase YjhB (NUDIX family)
VHKIGNDIRLYTRSGKDWSSTFASTSEAVRTQIEADRIILDVELVGFGPEGNYIEPSLLIEAASYRCWVLDVLYFEREDVTDWPTTDRIDLVGRKLRSAIGKHFLLADYTILNTCQELSSFYASWKPRRFEGFDGVILKGLSTKYFSDVWKLKADEPLDVAVIGAYFDRHGGWRSLLLAAPNPFPDRWVPVGELHPAVPGWDEVCNACQSNVQSEPPDSMMEMTHWPDVWIEPKVIIEVLFQVRGKTDRFSIGRELYPRRCRVRYDKGIADATSLDKVQEIVGVVAASDNPRQLALFDAPSASQTFQDNPSRPYLTTSEKKFGGGLEWLLKDTLGSLRVLAQTSLLYSTNSHERKRLYRILNKVSELAAAINAGLTMDEDAAESLRENWFIEVLHGSGYITHKVNVAAAVFDSDSRILLVRRHDEASWDFPTGWSEIDRSPAAQAAMEVHEETGLTVVPEHLVGIYNAARWGFNSGVPSINLLFYCRLEGGNLKSGDDEIAEARFFGFSALPELIPGVKVGLDRAHDFHRGQIRPTYFDS